MRASPPSPSSIGASPSCRPSRAGNGGGAAASRTLGTGVEFQVARQFAITPYINFVRATGFNRSEGDFGVKGTYRFTRQWGLTAGVQYEAISHAKDATQYTLGVNYHY
jgi:hypothetical protein